MAAAQTAVRPPADAHASAAEHRPGRVLAALLGAMFLGNVDIAVANIAGPSIRAGLHATTTIHDTSVGAAPSSAVPFSAMVSPGL